MLSQTQRERILIEKKLLEREFPQGRFLDLNGSPHFEVAIKTSGGQEFTLDAVLGEHFPDKMPRLYVVSPHRLPKRGNCGSVNAEGNSHAFHTLKNGPGGVVQICHFKPSWWDSSKTVCAAIIKGVIWCECYMAYLHTGKSIYSYCA